MKRHDGRGPSDLRPIEVIHGFINRAEGSVFIKQGDTWVLCNVSVEEDVPPFLKDSGKGWITAEYSMLPRSTGVRMPREAGTGKVRGRTHEIQRLIGRSLRAVVDLERLCGRTLRVDCDVIQADGGTRTASVTGAYLAMTDAVRHLMKHGLIEEDPVLDTLAAVSVGLVDGEVLLDLDYEEDSRAEVDANFVITGSNRLVEVQGTGEAGPFSWERFHAMEKMAQAGVRAILRRVMADA